jgi:hypothetical protein
VTDPTPSGGDRDTHTRRAVLAGGVAGAVGAAGLGPSAAGAQVFPLDALYVWRDREPVNVRDKGAMGDGRTDDTAAIQLAIDTVAAAGGGAVFLPAGDYVVNGGLTIAPATPTRLVGAGMSLDDSGATPWPTRLIRNSGATTMLSALGADPARVAFELSDLELRGSGTPGILVDVQVGSAVQLYRVRFAGASATGLRMRNVFNSSGSHLRWVACGAGTAAPACVLDAVDGTGGGRGCDTLQWDDLQFEGNGGTDLRLTGDGVNSAGSGANVIQLSQVKMEGGTAGAVGCPYIDLDYSQSCTFSDVQITVHGGRTVPPLRKFHPFGGTRADRFVNLTIDSTGGDRFPYGIDHFKSAIQLENVTILGAATAAIRVRETVGANEFQLGNLITTAGRAVIDERTALPSVAAAETISPPRATLVAVTGGGTITTITPHEAGYVTTFALAADVTVGEGGNLRLARRFGAKAGDTLTLACDGASWHEVARSAR